MKIVNDGRSGVHAGSRGRTSFKTFLNGAQTSKLYRKGESCCFEFVWDSAVKWKDVLRRHRSAESRRRYGETFVASETFCSSFSPKRNDTVSRNGLTSKVSAFLECIAFALRAWRSYLARNWPGEMLHMSAGTAFPAERSQFDFAREEC